MSSVAFCLQSLSVTWRLRHFLLQYLQPFPFWRIVIAVIWYNKNIFSLLTAHILSSKMFHFSQALEGVKLRLERTSCVCSPKYCSHSLCKVKPLSREVATLNIIGKLLRPLTTPIYAMDTYYQFSNNEYRPAYIHIVINYCDNESGVHISALQEALKTALGNHTNVFQRCPIQPGDFYLKNFNFDASHLPSIIPVGRYLFKTCMYEKNETVFNISTHFQVTYHGVLDLNMG